MVEYKNKFILSVFIVVFFSPILFLGKDLWDGVIISHAFETNNPEIYRNWFIESGWFLTPYMYDVFYFLFGDERFLLGLQLSFLVCHLFSTFQIYKLCRHKFNLADFPSFISCIFFAFSPIWSIYFSSVFLMHTLTLSLALYCLNQMLNFSFARFSIFSIVSFIAFQQASIPPLIISLLCFSFILSPSKLKFKYIACYIFISMIYFFTTRYYFPAHGLYTNYNSISINNLINYKLYEVFVKYIQFVYPFLFLLLAFIFTVEKRERIYIFIFLLLILINVIPFILVGKPAWPSHFTVIEGWDQRQAITLTVIIAIIFGFLSQISTFSQAGKFKLIMTLVIVGGVFVMFVRYYNAIEVKAKSVKIQDEITELLSENSSKIGSCGIVLTIFGPPEYRNLSIYELNYLAWKAFGYRKYIYASTRQPNNIFIDASYRDKYILPRKLPLCMKNVKFYTNVYSLDIFDVLFEKKHNYYLEIN